MHEALGAALKEARDAGGARGRDHRRRPRLLRRPGSDRVPRGRRATSASGCARNYHPNVLAIRALEKPVIAAVNGAGRGRRPLVRLRVRHPHRRRLGDASCPPSSTSASSPTRAARISSPACSATARAFEWMTLGPQAHRGRGARVGPRLRGRRGRPARRRAPPSSPPSSPAMPTRGVGMTKRLFDHAEHDDARGAARARGAAADGRDADDRLPRGRGRVPREARAALRGSLNPPVRIGRMETTASATSDRAAPHPIRWSSTTICSAIV